MSGNGKEDKKEKEVDVPLTFSILKQLLEAQTTDLRNEINDVKSEIQQSEEKVINHIEEKLMEVRTDINDLQTKLKEKDEEIQALKTGNDRERRSRNIVIFKVPENESNVMDLKVTVIRLVSENCKVDISQHIDKIYRIGRKEGSKIRPILLSLMSFDKKMEIMYGKKQHHSNLEISEDFSPAVLEARKKLVPVLKALRELNYKNVQLRQDKLFIDGKVCEEDSWAKMISSDRSTDDSEKHKTGSWNFIATKSSEQNATQLSNTTPQSLLAEKPPSTSQVAEIQSLNETMSVSSPNTKRLREHGTESPPRATKQTKTTIIGSNSNQNTTSLKNPIKEALKKQMLNSNISKNNQNKA